jgi:hypothetical protein
MNMDELSKVALMALIGTSVTTFIGYRQWKRRPETTRQANSRPTGKLLRKGESSLCAAPTRQVEM